MVLVFSMTATKSSSPSFVGPHAPLVDPATRIFPSGPAAIAFKFSDSAEPPCRGPPKARGNEKNLSGITTMLTLDYLFSWPQQFENVCLSKRSAYFLQHCTTDRSREANAEIYLPAPFLVAVCGQGYHGPVIGVGASIRAAPTPSCPTSNNNRAILLHRYRAKDVVLAGATLRDWLRHLPI